MTSEDARMALDAVLSPEAANHILPFVAGLLLVAFIAVVPLPFYILDFQDLKQAGRASFPRSFLNHVASLFAEPILTVIRILWTPRGPPGPWSWPIFGYLPALRKCAEPHLALQELADKYGPIMSLRLGCRRAVVITSPDLAKEVLRGPADVACSSRPPFLTWRLLAYDGQDLAFAPRGPRHTLARRLCTMHLFTARRMEAWKGVRNDEVSALVDAVTEEASASSGVVSIRPHISRTSLNNILRMVCGKRYAFNRPGKRDMYADEVTSVVFKVANLLQPLNLVDHVPGWELVEKYVLKDGASVRCRRLAPKLQCFFEALVQEHRKRRTKAAAAAAAGVGKSASLHLKAGDRVPIEGLDIDDPAAYTPKEEPSKSNSQDDMLEAERDFADVLLSLQDEERAQSMEAEPSGRDTPGSPGGSQRSDALTDDEIKAVLQDMVVAGTETSTATVEWALAELIQNPEAQRKLQAELDTAAAAAAAAAEGGGATKIVETSWKLMELPYLQAVVKETLRLHPPGTLLMPHFSMEPCSLGGGRFDIAANTVVLVNSWAISRDPSIWVRPHDFIPERFLDPSYGSSVNMDMRGGDPRLLPFGAGRRSCVGLRLGHTLVTLMLARLVQAFEWLPLDEERGVDMAVLYGLASRKKVPLEACVRARFLHGQK